MCCLGVFFWSQDANKVVEAERAPTKSHRINKFHMFCRGE